MNKVPLLAFFRSNLGDVIVLFRTNLNLASIYCEEAITLEGFDLSARSCLVKPSEDVFLKALCKTVWD